MTDGRPDPKPRKLFHLWQAYLFVDELVEMRKRHLLRIDSIEKGKSNLDADFERDVMTRIELDKNITEMRKLMVACGKQVGPIWNWVTSFRGMGTGNLAAMLLAQIDDIGKFDTISKLWRFCGLAVVDGKAERNRKGEKSKYNRRLKSLILGPTFIVDQFILHHASPYREIYDDERDRLAKLFPHPTCNVCTREAILKSKSWVCQNGCKPKNGFKVSHTPMHLKRMAYRKVGKIFLSHLWVTWRRYDGLPVTEPYVQAILGHTNIIEPSPR